MCGGPSSTQPATAEIQAITDQVGVSGSPSPGSGPALSAGGSVRRDAGIELKCARGAGLRTRRVHCGRGPRAGQGPDGLGSWGPRSARRGRAWGSSEGRGREQAGLAVNLGRARAVLNLD